MSLYQLLFYTPDGAYPMLDLSECADDGAAMGEALSRLRQHGSCKGVDVYEEDRMVARLKRPNGFAPSRAPALRRLR